MSANFYYAAIARGQEEGVRTGRPKKNEEELSVFKHA